jgi:Transposase
VRRRAGLTGGDSAGGVAAAWQGAARAVYAADDLADTRWEAEILAWYATDGCSNGPIEAVNLLIKKIKRVGHGYRNFTTYRLLLHCGVAWPTHQTARQRGRSPQWAA